MATLKNASNKEYRRKLEYISSVIGAQPIKDLKTKNIKSKINKKYDEVRGYIDAITRGEFPDNPPEKIKVRVNYRILAKKIVSGGFVSHSGPVAVYARSGRITGVIRRMGGVKKAIDALRDTIIEGHGPSYFRRSRYHVRLRQHPLLYGYFLPLPRSASEKIIGVDREKNVSLYWGGSAKLIGTVPIDITVGTLTGFAKKFIEKCGKSMPGILNSCGVNNYWGSLPPSRYSVYFPPLEQKRVEDIVATYVESYRPSGAGHTGQAGAKGYLIASGEMPRIGVAGVKFNKIWSKIGGEK